MKKQFFTLAFALCATYGYSQLNVSPNTFPTTGRVGIGTSTPTCKLQILRYSTLFAAGGANYAETILSVGSFASSSLQFETYGSYFGSSIPNPYHVQKLQMYDESNKVGYLEFNSQPTVNTTKAAVSFGNNGIEFMRINQNGRVRIGSGTNDIKTPAGYKLFVEEGILTEKIKVAVKTTANWADYVFAEDYKLMPLTEVEEFTKKNKHLPNVPSAKQMVENGLDVAQMDAKLIEKVEELTLYLIEQNKQIELLKTEITALKNQK